MRKAILSALLLGTLLGSERRADAFCGFYVAPSDAPLYADATMVALMREGTRTALSMSNNYKGPAADFAMVVPVPVVLQKDNVKTLKHDVFKKLEQLTAPRLVEYWEQDPCPPPMEEKEFDSVDKASAPMAVAKGAPAGGGGYGVKIESQFSVGEYDVVVLSAEQSDGLERYLVDNKYNIPKGAAAALAPYVKEQMKFFVAKIDIKKVSMDEKGVAVLSRIRVHYESPDFRLPVRLGLLNSNGKQDLIVWTLSKQNRYEVANYKNEFIPTNIDVSDETRSAFGPFYAALFDAALEKAGGRAVITEYSWTSSGCDPCPTPPMTDNDVAALGGDALLGMKVMGADNTGSDSPGAYYGGSSQPMVLTRLHARYDSTTLTDDLVFKTAEPIVGGREFLTMATPPGTDPKKAKVELEKSAKPSSYNQFQARYAIRHPWKGAIACANPRRGVWGGPPYEEITKGAKTGPVPATDLAAAPRGGVQLAKYVVSPVAELAMKIDGPPAGSAPDGTFPSGHAPATIHSRHREQPPPVGYFMLGFAGAGIVLLGIALGTKKRA
jgi:hypothetical protein